MAHDEMQELRREVQTLQREVKELRGKVAGAIALNVFAVVIGALAILMTVWWIPANVDAWNRNADILERAFPAKVE